MKNALLSALLLAGSVVPASHAFAGPDASTDITISGTAPKVCATSVALAAELSFGAALIDSTTNVANGAQERHSTGHVMCNYAAYVSLKTANGALTDPDAEPETGFDNFVNYTATATWGGVAATLTTDGTPNAPSSGIIQADGPRNSDLVLSVRPIAAGIVVAGDNYTDTLTVQVGADL